MKTIHLKTMPPSVNKMYRGRRFLTRGGKETKEAIAWEVASQYKGKVLKGEVCLNIIFYVKDNRSDIDNMLKALMDCLTGLIYEDDKQVVELHVIKMLDKENPRVELQVV